MHADADSGTSTIWTLPHVRKDSLWLFKMCCKYLYCFLIRLEKSPWEVHGGQRTFAWRSHELPHWRPTWLSPGRWCRAWCFRQAGLAPAVIPHHWLGCLDGFCHIKLSWNRMWRRATNQSRSDLNANDGWRSGMTLFKFKWVLEFAQFEMEEGNLHWADRLHICDHLHHAANYVMSWQHYVVVTSILNRPIIGPQDKTGRYGPWIFARRPCACWWKPKRSLQLPVFWLMLWRQLYRTSVASGGVDGNLEGFIAKWHSRPYKIWLSLAKVYGFFVWCHVVVQGHFRVDLTNS